MPIVNRQVKKPKEIELAVFSDWISSSMFGSFETIGAKIALIYSYLKCDFARLLITTGRRHDFPTKIGIASIDG